MDAVLDANFFNAPPPAPELRQEIDASLAGLWTGLFEVTNPILIKAALQMTGMIPTDVLRLPLVQATPDERDRLGGVLAGHGIKAA